MLEKVKKELTPRRILGRIIRYILQGMLVIAPIGLTIYIVYWLFILIDSGFQDLLSLVVEDYKYQGFTGFGAVVGILLLLVIGFISSNFLFGRLFKLFDRLITKMPLIKIVYTSIKDLFSAFVSEEKKFNKPVLVNVNESGKLQKLGFITEEDLSELGLKDKVAVYLPHSYNFSGNLFIVSPTDLTPLDASSTEVMKFIVSGGVTDLSKPENGG